MPDANPDPIPGVGHIARVRGSLTGEARIVSVFELRTNLTPEKQGVSMTEGGIRKAMKRVGVIGFLFFLAKGLVWLAVAGFAALLMQ